MNTIKLHRTQQYKIRGFNLRVLFCYFLYFLSFFLLHFSSNQYKFVQVNAYLGAFIEGFATLLCRLASRTIADLGMRHATFIDSFIGTSLVVAGI